MPKLQTIDGKTKHYAYTPEGRKAYERDKAAMKMSPTAKLPANMGSKSRTKSKKRNGIY